MYHLATEHTDINPGSTTIPAIPGEFLVGSFITTKEEMLLGVDREVTDNWRDELGIPDSDGFKEICRDMNLKRDRPESSVSTGPKKLARR